MIGFDLDGVLARSDSVFKAWFWYHHKWDAIEGDVQTVFDYALPEGKTGKWIADEIGSAIAYWSDKILPYHKNLVTLQKFYERTGEPIQIVTARSPKTHQATELWLDQWLKQFGIKYDLTMVGFSKEKLETLRGLNIDVYVDDRYRTVQNLAGKLDEVFLLNRPWNKGRKTNKGIIRVDNLSEMYDNLDTKGVY